MENLTPPTIQGTVSAPVDAAAMLAGPSIALMVTGIVGIVVSLLLLALQVFQMAWLNSMQEAPQEQRGIFVASAVAGGAIYLLGACSWAFVIYGSIKMRRLENWGLALATAIVAMVPCSYCFLLGLPFGIWAVVVLAKPQVKEAFAESGVTRGVKTV